MAFGLADQRRLPTLKPTMAQETLFQKIIRGEIPAQFAFQDEHCVALHDINPQAPVHLLIIPKEVIPRLGEATEAQSALLGHLLSVAGKLGQQHAPEGFRVVINHGKDGGETIPHLHLHLLGGRALSWPPG